MASAIFSSGNENLEANLEFTMNVSAFFSNSFDLIPSLLFINAFSCLGLYQKIYFGFRKSKKSPRFPSHFTPILVVDVHNSGTTQTVFQIILSSETVFKLDYVLYTNKIDILELENLFGPSGEDQIRLYTVDEVVNSP